MIGPSEAAAAHREEFFAALHAQGAPVEREQRPQRLVDRLAELLDRLFRGTLRAAQRLGHDPVDDPEPQQILRR